MSDQQKRGKKRGKSYYIKCSNQKKRKTNCLESGLRGFLVTCNSNEKRAVQETYSILNEYADQLYGPEKVKSKAADDASSKDESDAADDSAEEDIEEAMQKEVQAIKESCHNERRFQNVESKASNCIFIKTTLEDPHHLVHSIFCDLVKRKVQKTRYAIRLLPISATCRAAVTDIEKLAKTLFIPSFQTPLGSGLGYSILFKSRNSSAVCKDAVLPALGHIIKELNPLHYVNYDSPDFVILVEVIRNICCLGIVKDFYKFRKYNLHEITKPQAEKIKHKESENECYSVEGNERIELVCSGNAASLGEDKDYQTIKENVEDRLSKDSDLLHLNKDVKKKETEGKESEDKNFQTSVTNNTRSEENEQSHGSIEHDERTDITTSVVCIPQQPVLDS